MTARSLAAALPLMCLHLRLVRESIATGFARVWRWDVVLAIHVDVQRIFCRVKKTRTHVEERARNLFALVDRPYVPKQAVLVPDCDAAQVACERSLLFGVGFDYVVV